MGEMRESGDIVAMSKEPGSKSTIVCDKGILPSTLVQQRRRY